MNILNVLRLVGFFIPDIPLIRAIPNRILKPIHLALGYSGSIVDVLDFKMKLDPKECVDGWLWFSPHLYDRVEIDFLMKRFPDNGVFLDIGANIGFWSLRFAQSFPRALVCAIEANPNTFQILKDNIEINHSDNILPINSGVSDDFGKLPLYLNLTGNRGGDSFASYADQREASVLVNVAPLFETLNAADIFKIDIMKMDIEGFEGRVLRKFFKDAPHSLWPKYICVEALHVPEVITLLKHYGYQQCLMAKENVIFNYVEPVNAN
jgi:FkbM family methyltransferase